MLHHCGAAAGGEGRAGSAWETVGQPAAGPSWEGVCGDAALLPAGAGSMCALLCARFGGRADKPWPPRRSTARTARTAQHSTARQHSAHLRQQGVSEVVSGEVERAGPQPPQLQLGHEPLQARPSCLRALREWFSKKGANEEAGRRRGECEGRWRSAVNECSPAARHGMRCQALFLQAGLHPSLLYLLRLTWVAAAGLHSRSATAAARGHTT